MPKPASALRVAVGVVRDIEDDAVGCGRSAQPKSHSGIPGVGVVAAGRVSAHADCAYERSIVVKCKPCSEDVDAADSTAHHRVVVRAVVLRAASVGAVGINRIAVLQTVETTAGLGQGVEIGR